MNINEQECIRNGVGVLGEISEFCTNSATGQLQTCMHVTRCMCTTCPYLVCDSWYTVVCGLQNHDEFHELPSKVDLWK